MGRNSKDNSLDKYVEVLKISVRYFDYLQHPRMRITLSSKYRDNQNDAVKYVNKVKKTLDKIDKLHKDIVLKEFFGQAKERYWWIPYYSKSSYYRLRNEAIHNFLEEFSK